MLKRKINLQRFADGGEGGSGGQGGNAGNGSGNQAMVPAIRMNSWTKLQTAGQREPAGQHLQISSGSRE